MYLQQWRYQLFADFQKNTYSDNYCLQIFSIIKTSYVAGDEDFNQLQERSDGPQGAGG